MDGSSGPSSGASGAGTDMGEGSAGGGSSSSSGSGGGGAGAAAAGGGDTRPSVRFTGRRGSRRRGVQNINHVDQILREILISVSGGGNGAGASGPMFFMGNPGDYAWGREGIDTIVTQLLNQMDNSGPPPLEKERIAAIPTVTISEEQVERKLQCSVCFEDFVVGESVRKLPCLVRSNGEKWLAKSREMITLPNNPHLSAARLSRTMHHSVAGTARHLPDLSKQPLAGRIAHRCATARQLPVAD